MIERKLIVQFTLLTFGIAYFVSIVLIVLGHFGYSVYNWVQTFLQFAMNIPFAIYILSPAIASYIILKKNNKVSGFKEWLKAVFYVKSSIFSYLFIILGLVLYFGVHVVVVGRIEMSFPFYTFFLSLPGCFIIGGLEEAGWMYILQLELNKKYGFIRSSILTGVIWVMWHIPLFFISGTNHRDGLINFWMFTIQLMAFRFFYGVILKISGKGRVFISVLFHTMFNAVSPIFGTTTTTWGGTIAANAVIILVSIGTVIMYDRRVEI